MLDRTIIPEIKEFGTLSIPVPTETTLSNGIKLVVLDQGEQEVNRLTISWTGGVAETDKPAALPVACELIKEGAGDMSGAEIAELLDFNGSWLRISAESHYTVLSLHSLNSRLPHVLPAISAMLSAPTFPEKEFETIKEKLARQRELEAKKVTYHAMAADRRLVFGENHPLAKVTTPEDFRNVTLDEVRQAFAEVFPAYPPTAYLAGRITPEVLAAVTAMLESLTFRHESDRKPVVVAPSPDLTVKAITVDRPESLQAAVRLSIPTIARSHPDYNNLRLTVMALGGYFGSRLMSNIREDKGYTYGISAGVSGLLEGGVMTIDSQCDNVYTLPLIEEAKKELEVLSSTLMDDDELSHVRRFAMTSLAAILDSPFSIMDYYTQHRHLGTPPDYFMAQQDAIRSLDAGTIREMARKYLSPDKLYTSIAGATALINQ